MGPLLMTFVEVDLKDPLHVAEDDDEITKYEDVASYNWMNEKESTIVVPGPQLIVVDSTITSKLISVQEDLQRGRHSRQPRNSTQIVENTSVTKMLLDLQLILWSPLFAPYSPVNQTSRAIL